jgi:glutamine synthetase
MQKNGAGFAGFATWLDMTPADPDLFAMPDPTASFSCPGSRRSAGSPRRPLDERQAGRACAAQSLKPKMAESAKKGYEMKTGVECEFFLLTPDGNAISDAADTQSSRATISRR